MMMRLNKTNVIFGLGLMIASMTLSAQTQAPDTTRLPSVTVNSDTASQDPAKLPVSVTVVTGTVLNQAAATTISDVEHLVPNTFFWEPSARKQSSARFRGVGSTSTSPGVTTFIDGVPQL